MSDPQGSKEGNTATGNTQEEPTWKKAGFESEADLLEKATKAVDASSKLEAAEVDRDKWKSSAEKIGLDYQRQSNEVGELRKKTQQEEKGEREKTGTQEPPNDEQDKDKKELTPEEILETLTDEEKESFDKVLDDEKNRELKAKVMAGGEKAMAEFVKSYRENVPVDLSKPVFKSLKEGKQESVPKSTISKMVKSMFDEHENEKKNGLPAVSGGSMTTSEIKPKATTAIGGVSADFFKANK